MGKVEKIRQFLCDQMVDFRRPDHKEDCNHTTEDCEKAIYTEQEVLRTTYVDTDL